MYPVSRDYLQAIAGRNREFFVRCKFDGLEDYITEKNIRMGSYTDIIDGNGIVTLGNACSNKIEMTIINFTKPYVWKGSRFSIEKGFKLLGEIVWVPWGTFWVTEMSSSNDKRTIKLTAYDYMYKLAKVKYATGLIAPFHYRDLLDEFFQSTGMTLSTTAELPDRNDDDYMIEVWPDGDHTYSDMVGHLAGMLGCNARVSAADPTVMEFVWYTPTGTVIESTLYQDGFERLADGTLRVDYLVTGDSGQIKIDNEEESTDGELDFRPFDAENPDDFPWLIFTYDNTTMTASVQINEYFLYITRSIRIPGSLLYQNNIYTVTSIVDNGFRSSVVEEISLPDSMLTIGSYAFDGCAGLKEFTIPEKVTSIGVSVFRGCTNLTLLYYNAINGSGRLSNAYSITTVIVGEGVESIPDQLFWGCEGITYIHLPSSVTYIGQYAFADTNISSITIPENVTTIGGAPFMGCSKLTTMYFNAVDVTECGRGYLANLERLVVGIGVKKVPGYLFYEATNLSSVTIPASVTYIGEYAFRECTSITVIELPGSIKEIAYGAFYGCTGITSIDLPAQLTTIGRSAFDNCTGITSLVIPDAVETIEPYAFASCTNLTSAQIGTTAECAISEISIYAFRYNTALTDITIYKPADSVGGSPWGASNATITWLG